MDTVKVDLQRLQILNDRIAQTIDALNQVRLSVHGLTHSNPYGFGQQQYGQPQQQIGYPQQQVGYPQQQVWYPQQAFGGYGTPSPFLPGLQHTSPWTPQYGYPQMIPQLGFNPFQVPYNQGIQHSNPWFQAQHVPQWLQPQLGPQGPIGQTIGQPYGGFGGGIQHTSAGVDPMQAMWMAQTFPNALYQGAPVTII